MPIARPDSFIRESSRIRLSISRPGESQVRNLEGWLQSEVSLSLEAIAGTFSVPVDLTPGTVPAVKRQDEVRVYIGEELVITGHVLAAEPFYRRGDCGLRVMGRSGAGDLVRCSAVHQGGQWKSASAARIVADLVKPYGLQVVVEAKEAESIVKDFKLSHGESVLDAVSRAARLKGLLVNSDNRGRVLLTRAGLKTFGGAIVRGQNVISMEGIGSDENRHSRYIVYGQSNCHDDFEVARGLKAQADDKEMLRHLPLVINADGNTTKKELQDLVEHTVRVRRGHSMGLRYVVEGWTYRGKPWALGQKVVVYDDIAGVDGQEWLICSVRHTCDLKEGDVTELIVRPLEAYDTVPLKTSTKRRNWGNKGNRTNHERFRGPSDKAGD